jgi:hypothetical protein
MDRKIIQERFENIINAIEAERKHDELFFKNLHESKSITGKGRFRICLVSYRSRQGIIYHR